jgi:lysophospholipase L1-like esterase
VCDGSEPLFPFARLTSAAVLLRPSLRGGDHWWCRAKSQFRGGGEAARRTPAHPQVVLLGDSLVADAFHSEPAGGEGEGGAAAEAGGKVVGWGSGLQGWFGQRADVVARGLRGYNTQLALALLGRLFPLDDVAGPFDAPRLFVVCFGANDAVLQNLNPAQHVPLKRCHMLRSMSIPSDILA